MKTLAEKWRLILRPFLLIAFGCIAGYTLLDYLLFILLGWGLNEDWYLLWFPLLLPWVPVLLWFRPRAHLLRFKNPDRAPAALQMVAAFTIAGSTIIAQQYLHAATGTLTVLPRISAFETTPLSRYYDINGETFPDRGRAGSYGVVSVSGKQRENLNMSLYCVLPLFDNPGDAARKDCRYWICRKYSRTISNNLGDEEKDRQWDIFARDSQADFDGTDLGSYTYLERMRNTNDYEHYRFAVGRSGLVQLHKPEFFTPRYTPFSERSGNSLPWALGTLAIGFAILFLVTAVTPLKKNAQKIIRQGRRGDIDSFAETFGILRPTPGNLVGPSLILINIAIYAAMVCAGLGFLQFSGDDLLRWGGNYRPEVVSGAWWRLLASVFLHGGLMHLVANMTGLLFAGVILEPFVKPRRLLAIYIVSGLGGSVASVCWHPDTVSVGASGAIFGWYGALLVLLLMRTLPPAFGKIFLGSTILFLGYNLVIGMAGGVDNAAHLGGLLTGAACGLLIHRFVRGNVGADAPGPGRQ